MARLAKIGEAAAADPLEAENLKHALLAPVHVVKTPRTRFLIIANPRAGRRRDQYFTQIVTELNRRGAIVEQHDIGHLGSAAALLARCERFDATLAIGGDGTFRCVASVFQNRPIPICVAPAGTGNVLAREIGLPRDPSRLAEIFMTGDEVEIIGARANGEPFFLMAGAGFDGDVVSNLSHWLKRRIGQFAYSVPVLRNLSNRPSELELVLDGRLLTASWVVAARGSHYAGAFRISKQASLYRKGLQVVVFRAQSRLGRLLELLALATGQMAHCPTIETYHASELKINSPMPAKVQVDGDLLTTTPVVLSTRNNAPRVRLIVPQRGDEDR